MLYIYVYSKPETALGGVFFLKCVTSAATLIERKKNKLK